MSATSVFLMLDKNSIPTRASTIFQAIARGLPASADFVGRDFFRLFDYLFHYLNAVRKKPVRRDAPPECGC